MVVASGALTMLTYASGHAVFANYLGLDANSRAAELTIFCGALTGASLGFRPATAPHVPMKFRGMGVVPGKPKLAPVRAPQKNSQLRRPGIGVQAQVVSKHRMTAGVCQHCQGARCDHHQPDRQAVQSIGQIDGVRKTDPRLP